MAINKKPQSSGTDAARNQSGANINGVKPQKPDLGSSLQDFPDNVSSSINPPVSTVSKSNPSMVSITTRPWWQMWQIWGILLVLCSGGIGYGATSMLLKLPKTQSCSKVLWPIASASVRLYCAQTAAEERDVKGLLSAIDLVAVLPENHPLRPEINRNIDRWATSILEIGEAEFQAGNLDQAIATAKKIPNHVSASKLVEEKIENWQSVWSTGEETYEQVENKLREADWNGAFTWAVRLTDSSNDYWATTKYEESINNINVAQEENASLTKAKTQLTNGRIEDLILAIDRADDIKKNSYTYDQAQEIIVEAKSKLVASIEQLIEDREWQQLLQVTGRIPRSLGLQKRNRDWRILANAGASANLDTAFGIEDAIEEAEKLEKDSEYYRLGQKLIKRWKLEIKDVARLRKARDFARVGTIGNLNKAVSEAKLIPKANPRYSEAREEIAKWRGQIKTIEDKPVLNRARELSYGSNVNAWRRAIAEASSISGDSPLYSEAQGFIRSWRSNIQRVEDRPILDEAESFANINNYPAAIETAQQISSGRALYAEAQNSIARWQQEIDGQRYLRQANELALRGTFDALSRAIQIAKQAPASSSVRGQVLQDVNEWAAQILAIARQAANTSLERGIAIAEQVPAGTTSYTPAQKDIKIWQIQLNPPQPEIVPPTFKLDKLRKEREN
ncbi:MAG: chromosome segregation ATPase [Cyanobacteria bacterium P01_G01_bin.39]